MKGYLGVDLGSTTTKAVLLSPEGTILGRGITNTRANFEAASAIASAEALADARFSLLESVLRGDPKTAARADALGHDVRVEHRRAERRHRLERLLHRCEGLGTGADGPIGRALSALFELLREQTLDAPDEALYAEALHAEAATAAEAAAASADIPYERLMGIFERALVADESDTTVLDPTLAIQTVERGETLSDGEFRALRQGRLEEIGIVAQVGTGYGRHRLPFAKEEIRSEILCHGLGAKRAFPDTRTVLDIGGQDTKAIQLDPQGLVTSFQMNDRCAAGCGRYLGYVADELSLRLSDLGPMALASSCPARINSTCTVFAGTEIRERLALGELREDVVAGLHRAIVVRALSLLARSGGVKDALTFSGGVGKNPAVVKYLQELVAEHYGPITINVSPDGIFNGAVGAALFARMDARAAC